MELANYGNLAQHIRHKSPLLDNQETVVNILRGCLIALVESTGNEILHRDIKPDNILLHKTPQGIIAKINDWSFATKITDTKNLLQSCGSPGYVAPEAIRFDMLYLRSNQESSCADSAEKMKTLKRNYRCHSMYVTKKEKTNAQNRIGRIENALLQFRRSHNERSKMENCLKVIGNKQRDIWALGLVAYEIVYGKFLPAIENLDYCSKNRNIYFMGLISLKQSTINSDFPNPRNALEELIFWMLRHNYEERWCAQQCLDYLNQYFPPEMVSI
jgi:serine/threonine protein kinase